MKVFSKFKTTPYYCDDPLILSDTHMTNWLKIRANRVLVDHKIGIYLVHLLSFSGRSSS